MLCLEKEVWKPTGIIMGLFPHRIEVMIDQLEQAIPYVSTGVFHFGKVERHDWRPVWDLCKRIQSEFRGCKDFPSTEAHQAAWQRFQEVRSRASELADQEKEAVRDQSKQLRDDILYIVKGCRYSPLDDVLFFFDPTTVDEMKAMGRRLNEAGQKLSENKQWMLAEHKSQCFEAIQEAREGQDMFWERRKQLSAERRQAHEHRRAENERKREAWEERTRANIQRNREKLSKAAGARDRTLDRIREIEDKLSETTSEKWQGIYSEWLSDAQAKLSDIDESIARIEGWVREDEDRLNN